MKDLHARQAASLLRKMVAEGEHETQDFKFTVNDPRKIARSISAFANNSGGHLLIGVDDNGNLKGVRSEEDIYVVESAASIYCKPECEIEFTALKNTGGGIIIKARVEPALNKPIYVKEEGNKLRAYYRVADENIAAHPLMVKYWKYSGSVDDAIVFGADSSRTSLLDLLSGGPLDIESIFLRVPMSKVKAESTMLELLSMKLIEFEYINRRFCLKLKTDL